jgi:hypothetical protein
VIVEATKLCGGKNGCGQVLPVREFGYTKAGFKTYCRACSSADGKRWYAENTDRQRGNVKRWALDNPIATKAKSLKKSAHESGPSDIDMEWIMERLDRGVCELKGIPFVYEWRHPFLPSIDRIDASQPGHMKDNCRIVLWGLNAFKGTASEEVFLQCLEAVSAAPNKS